MVCLLAFEVDDSLPQTVVNGVTMTLLLSEVHDDRGERDTTWMYTCVTQPPAHMIIRGTRKGYANKHLIPSSNMYVPTLQWGGKLVRNE